MLKQKIGVILRKSHFWRDAGFDELSELYVSNLLRAVALTIFMVFVPFYLYENDYSAVAILATFGLFFVVRVFADFGAGYYVARFGPKHTMIISCLLQIVSAGLLLSVPSFHWHPLVIALPWGASASFFFIAYHVAFSKVKHTPRAGHELGHMQAYEKLGHLVGPLVGGVIGSIFGAQYIFLTATLLLLASLWPLFLTAEPVKVRQKLDFANLPVRRILPDLKSYACLGIENTICINAWAFYVAVFVLSGAVYAQLGALSAIGVLSAIIAAKAIGRVTDTSSARRMLRVSAIVNSLMYVFRPFVQGLWGVLLVNIANEVVTTGYRMPFVKGMYAAADNLPGFRIAYIVSLEAFASTLKATAWFALAIMATVLPLQLVLWISFLIAALASIGIMSERFEVYNPKHRKTRHA